MTGEAELSSVLWRSAINGESDLFLQTQFFSKDFAEGVIIIQAKK